MKAQVRRSFIYLLLFVVPAWLPNLLRRQSAFPISELTTLELAIAKRHKVVFLGLAMKFVTSTLFRPIC
jgi:hypothetical protein